MHSMEPDERELALAVIAEAWLRVSDTLGSGGSGSVSVLAAVREVASALPERDTDISADFARHIGDAAVWYLDRATRRVGDPDRDGLTAAQRAVNLATFSAEANADDFERLFAVAAALNADDR